LEQVTTFQLGVLCCLALLLLLFYALRSIRPEGQTKEAKNKISTVARGPDLRQDKMTPE